MGVVLGAPHILGSPDNFELANPLKTPAHIMPEWYFLPFYTILRSVPQKTGGVLAMALAIVAIFLLPLAGRRLLCWGFFSNFIVLGWLGACPIEAPYPQLGTINATLYFRLLILSKEGLLAAGVKAALRGLRAALRGVKAQLKAASPYIRVAMLLLLFVGCIWGLATQPSPSCLG